MGSGFSGEKSCTVHTRGCGRKTDLSVDKLGLSVNLKLLVASDLSLPELTSQVQEAVSSYIQQTVGIAPKQVNVLVRNVAEPIRSRVN